jgi:YfiH family protein
MNLEVLQVEGLEFYRFPGLGALPGVVHGVFTRRGGVSPPPYASLNLSYSVGDDPGRVTENRRRVARVLGVAELVGARQVHGTEEAVIREGGEARGGEVREADILLTARPGVGLLIKQADCQAVLFYDPEHRVVASTHCGWRGQVHRVLTATVARLRFHFGSRPEALHAAISPGLGPCCAEFRHFRQEFPPELWSYQVRPHYFDLWQMSLDELLAAGLRPDHLEVARLCTRCRQGEFFSYRRDRITGRQGTVIALLPPDHG